MCGACGRTVVADDVLGAERTLRSQHIVAQTINGLCRAVPGAPSVQIAGDAWSLRSATGAVQNCSTVAELWAAFAGKVGTSVLPILRARIEGELPNASGLGRAVLLAGAETLERTARQDEDRAT